MDFYVRKRASIALFVSTRGHSLLCSLATSGARSLLVHLDHIEAHSLGEWAALANDDLIARLCLEGRRAVGRDHLVTLFVTTALLLDVTPLLSLQGYFEPKANALHCTGSLTGGARQQTSLAGEDVGLLLIRPLSLH